MTYKEYKAKFCLGVPAKKPATKSGGETKPPAPKSGGEAKPPAGKRG